MNRTTTSLLLSSLLLAACAAPSGPGASPPPAANAALYAPARAGSAATVPDFALTATMVPVAEAETGVMPQVGDAPGLQDGQAPVGLGFTLSPSMFLIGAAADMKIDDRLTVGPALHLGFDDENFLFAPFAQIKFFPMEDEGQKIQPFLQGGLGLTFLDRDNRGDDWGILLNAGGGLRYHTGESYSLGTTLLFHFVPDEVVNDGFYFTWEVVQLVLTF